MHYSEIEKAYLQAEVDYIGYIQELGGFVGDVVGTLHLTTKAQWDKLILLENTRTELREKWAKSLTKPWE